ncbi:hypothetical protein CGSHiR3021_01672 [Haemophilus influenzae 22.4-21]|uniref:Uncharacterized protein n=1 Tax=Haemophilus influenzae 22.4-21 TaxID=375063 RepID=A4NZ79_HAEIF|nr:hypothetical protein CGSHiR3021_01672 [Haemophilus influenzae 22.4-21]
MYFPLPFFCSPDDDVEFCIAKVGAAQQSAVINRNVFDSFIAFPYEVKINVT